jgi:hypothetical protein
MRADLGGRNRLITASGLPRITLAQDDRGNFRLPESHELVWILANGRRAPGPRKEPELRRPQPGIRGRIPRQACQCEA